MSDKISDKDMALLSAYLDGELKQPEHHRIAARLDKEADLRAALLELRQLKAVLGALPQPLARRHFTLGPEHARVSWAQRLGLPNSWGLASAVAGLMLVLVFAGELLTFGNPLTGSLALSAESAVTVQEEAFADVAAGEAAEDESADAPMALEAESAPAEDGALTVADEAEDKGEDDAAGADLATGETTARTVEDDVGGAAPFALLSFFRWAELGLALAALLSFWLACRRT